MAAPDELQHDGYGGSTDTDLVPPPTSMAEMKARLAERHGVAVGDDEPLLMTYTMLEIFLADLERVLEQQNSAVTNGMQGVGRQCADAVRECLDVLRDETLDTSLKYTLAQVADYARQTSGLVGTITRLRNWMIAIVGLFWLGVAAQIVLVFTR